MGRKYAIYDQQRIHFVTFTVVNWIDLFIRDEYRQIIIESLQYCQENKGLEIFAWCIMSSHVHLVIRAAACWGSTFISPSDSRSRPILM